MPAPKRIAVAAALVVAAVAMFFCHRVEAQVSTASGTVRTPWGYYIWQVDHGGVTTMVMSELGFKKSPGSVQIPVSLPATMTIQEVHGNVSFTVWSSSGCSSGATVAQVRDQDGNVIASVNLVGTAPASINLPISATLGTPLHITSLQLETYTAQCSPVTVSWSLVMS